MRASAPEGNPAPRRTRYGQTWRSFRPQLEEIIEEDPDRAKPLLQLFVQLWMDQEYPAPSDEAMEFLITSLAEWITEGARPEPGELAAAMAQRKSRRESLQTGGEP
jgi:hypothetical protein